MKEENRYENHIQERIINQNKMIHLMLKYPEVCSDLNFIAFPTMSLELRADVDKGSKVIFRILFVKIKSLRNGDIIQMWKT